tara:strand:- start:174 stop:710 length:537 start_codon:yes stop_codon:yes gene_type:complete
MLISSFSIIEEMATVKNYKNIYGKPLKKCRKQKSRKNRGSWDSNGYCNERQGGLHQICFKVNNATKDFSKNTYQSGWSHNRVNKNHCMCLGAWALYKARQNENQIKSTQNELVCDAIPEFAFSPLYISNWNTWNGHELEDQILDGIDAIYDQCYSQAKTPKEKKYLTNKYNNLKKFIY